MTRINKKSASAIARAYLDMCQNVLENPTPTFSELQTALSPDMYRTAVNAAEHTFIGRKQLVAEVVEARKALLDFARAKVANYDNTLEKIALDWKCIYPQYIMTPQRDQSTQQKNQEVLDKFILNVRKTFGSDVYSAMMEEMLRPNPIGSWEPFIKVREILQRPADSAWYMQVTYDLNDWVNLPYAAKVLKFQFSGFWDFPAWVMELRHGKDRPSRDLRELIKL